MVRFSFVSEEDPHLITLDDDSPKKGFTLNWVQELGWSANPFRPKEIRIGDMAEERKELNLFFVQEKTFGIIHGSEGMGKSLLLRWLSQELESYDNIEHVLLDAANAGKGFRDAIAEQFHGLIGHSNVSGDDELVARIAKYGNGTLVLLVDDAEDLTKENLKTLKELLTKNVRCILSSKKKLKGLPADDVLGLVVRERSPAQYAIILTELIAAVGGEEMKPFSQSVVERMARDTKNTGEFLSLAEETAVNVALKRSEVSSDVSDEDLVEEEEQVAEKKKGIRAKASPSTKNTKRKFDKLVESLSDEMR